MIVLQEWWGLVPHSQEVCRRLAGLGFVAMDPDLCHGNTTRWPEQAGKLMMAIDLDRTEQEILRRGRT